MNYIARPHSDELLPNCFPSHNNPGESSHKITKPTTEQPSSKEMLIAPPRMPDDHQRYSPIKIRRNPAAGNEDRCKKRVIHRDVERQRRHEMAGLYASLRTLLPLEFLKGKRSISDHMNEATNYIKHQQKWNQELTKKRDGLRRQVLSMDSTDSCCSSSSDAKAAVIVRPCWAGVEVVITASCDQIALSGVVMAMEEQGLPVVSCVSTYEHNQCFHTLQSEVSDAEEAELSKLARKLADLIRPLC